METIFQIHPQAIKMLQSIAEKKVAVLRIADPQRTWKSFLANRVLKRQKGFAVDPTTIQCTKGIWLWSQPIPLNENTTILLMDTEQNILNIFIAIINVCFVMNWVILMNNQQRTTLLLLNKERIQSEDKSLSQFFPTFLWVLRDFSLDLRGRTHGEYLEFALKDQSNPGPNGQRKNLIRRRLEKILNLEIDERRHARVEEEDWNALRPEFMAGVQDFEIRVFKCIPTKQINGTTLTAEIFFKPSLEYVDAINSGGIPQILTSLNRVIQQEARNLLEEMKSLYYKKYQEALSKMKSPYEDKELIQLKQQIEAEIFSRLDQKSKEIIDNSKIKLDQKLIENIYQRLRNELNGKRVECQQILKRMNDNNQSQREPGEEFSNDLVLQYKDMKQQAHQMNEFFQGSAMDHSQQSVFLQEITKLSQDKFNEIIKLRKIINKKKKNERGL